MTTIVSYPERGEGGNNKYRGNCSPKLIEDLITHYNLKEINDYMCGSGTTRDAANNMGIASNVHDLHSGFDMLNCEIPNRSQFTFWHPPYHNIIKYSDVMYSAADVEAKYGYDPRKSDLSRAGSWEEFVRLMNYCMMKQFCSLEKGGRMAVLVGDIKKKGKLYSMIFELIKPGTIEQVVIKAQHNCVSSKSSYSGKFIPIVHEYLLLVRKDDPLQYQIMQSRIYAADIREMKNSTWKDIVADVMDSFGVNKTVPLEQIYAKVDGSPRTKENQHWKAKVRQTLNTYTNLFASTQRGEWMMVA